MIALRPDEPPTLIFHVEGMVNSRVASAVTWAVRALDLGATIRTDPTVQRLYVEPTSSDAEDVVEILSVAGYVASPVTSTGDSAFAGVDSGHSAAGVSESFSLLPSEALGPSGAP
jgi:hypothetical protein